MRSKLLWSTFSIFDIIWLVASFWLDYTPAAAPLLASFGTAYNNYFISWDHFVPIGIIKRIFLAVYPNFDVTCSARLSDVRSSRSVRVSKRADSFSRRCMLTNVGGWRLFGIFLMQTSTTFGSRWWFVRATNLGIHPLLSFADVAFVSIFFVLVHLGSRKNCTIMHQLLNRTVPLTH